MILGKRKIKIGLSFNTFTKEHLQNKLNNGKQKVRIYYK
jgi:hypothetical protein